MMNITPALHVMNEEYWIGYVLRGLLRVFPRVVMLDTGSTDNTVEIARQTALSGTYGSLALVQEAMHGDAQRIGNCPNILREMVETEWMLLVDGDEIWGEAQLRALAEIEPPTGCVVGMCNGRNLAYVDGRLMEREGFSADRLFAREVRWNRRRDYPFQSHGLEQKFAAGQVFHTNFERSYFWHTRHLQRSSRDSDTFFRGAKMGYFPYSGPYKALPENWLGSISSEYPNPYLQLVSAQT